MRDKCMSAMLWALANSRRIFALLLAKHFPKIKAKLLALNNAVVTRVLQRSGFFDTAFYLQRYPEVAYSGLTPLQHYVTIGDAAGYMPMALFEPHFYRRHVKGDITQLNSLLHYIWVGRQQSIPPSPWFDPRYYFRRYPNAQSEHPDPHFHFLNIGGLRGYCPGPLFDSLRYLRDNPEIAEHNLNPLVHYLLLGRTKNLPIYPAPAAVEQGNSAPAFTQCNWRGLTPRLAPNLPSVAVIIPVYRGCNETLRCIYSVLHASNELNFALLVINDASPDLLLSGELHKLHKQGLFSLIEHAENRGFVHSINQGFAQYPNCDVVMLNADTEVYDGWLDRLHSAAARDHRTGTVTPLSNNATICSYPHFLVDNFFPLETSHADIDAIAKESNAGIEIEGPTGVGFCMYVKRACIEETGVFDEETFGQGYGEETDFCQRALKKGWRNIVACDVYVRHQGGISFQHESAPRIRAASRLMDKMHPQYHRDVSKFIRLDPLKEARRRLDQARIARIGAQRNVLLICHNRGGGTERHLQEQINKLRTSGHTTFVLRPAPEGHGRAIVICPNAPSTPNLPSIDLTRSDEIQQLINQFAIHETHVHSLIDFPRTAASLITAACLNADVKLRVTIHDYEIICPRLNLVDERGYYCGEPDEKGCNHCLAVRGSEFGFNDITKWRSQHTALIEAASCVTTPDTDVADRIKRYFPAANVEVRPHEKLVCRPAIPPRIRSSDNLRIVAIGAISPPKGYEPLLQCAARAKRLQQPLEFVLMGYSNNDSKLRQAGIHVTGPYTDNHAAEQLAKLKPAVIWIPSTCPETYSYTLSVALAQAHPIFAFELGAIASRLRTANRNQTIMPRSIMRDAVSINGMFLDYRANNLLTTPSSEDSTH